MKNLIDIKIEKNEIMVNDKKNNLKLFYNLIFKIFIIYKIIIN